MTPKQLQKKIEVLTRRFDRLRDSLSEQEIEIRHLKDLAEAYDNIQRRSEESD